MKLIQQPSTHTWRGVALALMASVSAQAGSLKVMSYNVQNLFDTVDNPATKDDEFTPRGAQRWTPEVLSDKMQNLAEVILTAAPDVVGLVEVENEAVVREFVGSALKGRYPYFAVANSSDTRGIRPALLSRFPIVSTVSHQVSESSWVERGERKFGRDILEVTVDTGSTGLITFLVNHWLSRAGGPARDAWRLEEARSLRHIIETVLQKNPERLVFAMGDFNDGVKDVSIRQGLGAVLSFPEFLNKRDGVAVYAVGGELADGDPRLTGTYYFHPQRQWNDLDHVFVAASSQVRGSLASSQARIPQFQVVSSRFSSGNGQPRGCEVSRARSSRGESMSSSSNANRQCPNGASDHWPVLMNWSL